MIYILHPSVTQSNENLKEEKFRILITKKKWRKTGKDITQLIERNSINYETVKLIMKNGERERWVMGCLLNGEPLFLLSIYRVSNGEPTRSLINIIWGSSQ